jgi:hypothetical protein
MARRSRKILEGPLQQSLQDIIPGRHGHGREVSLIQSILASAMPPWLAACSAWAARQVGIRLALLEHEDRLVTAVGRDQVQIPRRSSSSQALTPKTQTQRTP